MSRQSPQRKALMAALSTARKLPTLAAIQAFTGHRVPNHISAYLPPDSAPEGMTVSQAQLVWSGAAGLFTESELTASLLDSLQPFAPAGWLLNQRVSTLESLPSQSETYSPTVFSVLRKLATGVPEMLLTDGGSCIILDRSVWSHLCHHLLSLLVMSGQAPDSLNELLLQQDLGL